MMEKFTKEDAKAAHEARAKAVKTDGRICFGLVYFATEEEADAYARLVWKRGDTYNGGWFHGMRCGRSKDRDHVDKETGKKVFAVTER